MKNYDDLSSEKEFYVKDFFGLLNVLTPDRLAILKTIKNHGGKLTEDQLSERTQRDCKSINEDLSALRGIGLVTQDGGIYSVPYSSIRSQIVL